MQRSVGIGPGADHRRPDGSQDGAADAKVSRDAPMRAEQASEERGEARPPPWDDGEPGPGEIRCGPEGRRRAGRWAIVGTAIALLLSPALELVTGSEALYPAVALGLVVWFWLASGTTPREAGFTRGERGARAAVLYPLLVVAGAVVLATATGSAWPADTSPGTLALQVGTMTVVTALGTLLTEDGFFRGWLWGTLERAGREPEEVLLWTAASAALWHLPLTLIEPSLRLAPAALAVHLLDLWLLGLCWGLLRLASGSVLVVALSHGVWAGLVYTLFGFGSAPGALGIADSLRVDPERGWAGVALHAAAFLVLRRWWLGSGDAQAADPS